MEEILPISLELNFIQYTSGYRIKAQIYFYDCKSKIIYEVMKEAVPWL